MESGLVFNIQKYSLHDGPGIRTTVFLKGCPLNCAWCHNPEGIAPRREMLVIESRCIDCRECRLACPNQNPGEGPLPARSAVCTLCGACVEACPTEARQIVGSHMSVDEVLNAVMQDQAFFEESKGGVTFSGGEPLFQAGFLTALLVASKAKGVHTVIDTCGFAPRENLLRIAPLADLFLYDVKSIDDEKHLRFTGVSNRLVLENLIALGQVHHQIWIRVPLIPGFNDSESELNAIAHFVATIPAVKQVNLLSFHRTGAQKQRRLGRSKSMNAFQPPSAQDLERAVGIFRAAGVNVRLGG